MRPSELVTTWREEAAKLERWAPAVAAAFRDVADQLDRSLAEEGEVLLTLGQAAAESGYSSDHLGRLVKDGTVPSVGKKGAPRIRRADLPRKPGQQVARPQVVGNIQAITERALASRTSR